MTTLKSLFDEYLEANKDSGEGSLTVQDAETIMNKIIDARVEQKLAEYGMKPHSGSPAPGDPPKGS